MSDVSGVDNLNSGSTGDVSLTGIKSAVDNLNAGKAESSAVVPNTRQVAGHALSADVTLSKSDVGLGNVDNSSDTTKNSAAVTLTNKTIAGGSNTISGITEAMQSTSDVTTLNVSTSKHGYAPKAPNDTTKFLRGDGSWNAIPGAYLNGFGTWASATADGTGYQVTTDGFLVGSFAQTSTGASYV